MKQAAAAPQAQKNGGGRPTYNRDLIERFLCAHHKVDHPWQFIPFGNMIEAWEVMRPVTLTVECQVPKVTFFPHQSPESQVIKLPVVNNPSRGTRFLDSAAPAAANRFLHPVSKQPIPLDFERVCTYSIVTRHLASSVQWPVAVRLNFYHTGKELLEHRAEHDAMMEAGGAVRAAFVTLSPTSAVGQDVEVAAMPREPFAYRNEFFTSTMALVNSSNLQNGVVTIPFDICIKAGLPVFQGTISTMAAAAAATTCSATPMVGDADDEDADDDLANSLMSMSISETEQKLMETAKKRELKPITSWRAIPINHVLAWGMQSDEFARDRGLRVYSFYFTPPPELSVSSPEEGKPQKKPDDILLYYLIDDIAYYQLLDYFAAAWMNKVDVRPLESIAFEMLPLQAPSRGRGPEQVSGAVTVRSSITYYVPPKLSAAQIANLAPALCADFPTCHEWNPWKMPYLEDDATDTVEEKKK